MILFNEYLIRALDVFNDRHNTTYCLGASGEKVGSKKIKDLYEYYKAAYSLKPYSEWLAENEGKRCFDCSGFLDYIFVGEGNHAFSSWEWKNIGIPNESISKGVECSILWKPGHVGLDIGHGFYIHFPNWNRGCEFGKISDNNFTHSLLCPNVDYTGANNL